MIIAIVCWQLAATCAYWAAFWEALGDRAMGERISPAAKTPLISTADHADMMLRERTRV